LYNISRRVQDVIGPVTITVSDFTMGVVSKRILKFGS